MNHPLIVLTLTLLISYAVATEPIVKTNHGLLGGVWKASAHGRTFASFEGIPYARPPVGKYRFREPQNLKPWLGTWQAMRPGAPCLQYNPFGPEIQGSENCLFVNVYSPNLQGSLPVVVYIHGGAFMYGSGDLYGPKHLMDRELVSVTLNYRLGPLGFLSTGDDVIPGNAGLKDQAFALQWVRNNIAFFGGDPNKITLTGCSAGGASVNYQYLSPQSRGNFARGVAYSGASFASWTHSKKPLQKAKILAALVGCPTANNRDLADCLRYRPAETLVQAQIDMFDWSVHMFTPFTPTTEAASVKNPFLTRYPYHAAQAGQMHNVPLVAGVTTEEGLYPAAVYQQNPDILSDLEAHWDQLASNIFEYNDTLPLAQRSQVAQKIKQKYLGGKPVSQETFPGVVQALSDRLFVADVGRLVQIHAMRSGQPVYLYKYGFRGDFSLSNFMAKNKENYGVSHADDVIHIYDFELPVETEQDKNMTQVLLDFIESYATTGTPSINGVTWEPISPGSPNVKYLDIKAPGVYEMKSSSDFGHASFWDSLGFNENANYPNNSKDEL